MSSEKNSSSAEQYEPSADRTVKGLTVRGFGVQGHVPLLALPGASGVPVERLSGVTRPVSCSRGLVAQPGDAMSATGQMLSGPLPCDGPDSNGQRRHRTIPRVARYRAAPMADRPGQSAPR
ncbi:MAG: hypothetical protein JO362_03140 [Streptomycetaceae bacterium]|nr:hypothetical protein [Streptomycetaceae bacterium]